MYKKAYEQYTSSKGLYYLIDPKLVEIRNCIIQAWTSCVANDAWFFKGSNLIPKPVLENSGHIKQFGSEIFHVTGDLCLRPETAQSLFPNLKNIRRSFKGNPLKIYQIGDSFRNEKTTRGGQLRKRQFQQLELHVLAHKNYDFYNIYKDKLDDFFHMLNLKPVYKEISDKPHYALKTWDLYIESTQVGCINYRGIHDLYAFTKKQNELHQLYEVSLGLDRLIYYIHKSNKL